MMSGTQEGVGSAACRGLQVGHRCCLSVHPARKQSRVAPGFVLLSCCCSIAAGLHTTCTNTVTECCRHGAAADKPEQI